MRQSPQKIRPVDVSPGDGRRRRSLDSQQRIVDALLALVGEGHLSPSAEQVSQRAGVGLRSVFRHFKDMESLHRTMSDSLSVRMEQAARQPFPALRVATALQVQPLQEAQPDQSVEDQKQGDDEIEEPRHDQDE